MRNCNCQRRRPCCGGQVEIPNPGCGCVETVVEPTVHCRISPCHHHRRIRHIVPIVYHQAHHHHKHHEYEVRRRFKHQHNHHEHGRFEGDWCEVDRKQARGIEDSSFDQIMDEGEQFNEQFNDQFGEQFNDQFGEQLFM